MPGRATGKTPQLDRLKKRAQFLRIRGGTRWSAAAFLIEAKARPDSEAGGPARFGFTVSGKIGNAVVRNRVRRRLSAAIREVASEHARLGFDYVVVARKAAFDIPYLVLKADLVAAFGGLGRKSNQKTVADPSRSP